MSRTVRKLQKKGAASEAAAQILIRAAEQRHRSGIG